MISRDDDEHMGVLVLFFGCEVSFSTHMDRYFFLTAIWLPHGQLWAIIEGTASLTRC